MNAAVHAAEIAEQFRCEDCARDASLFDRRGRCTGDVPGGLLVTTFDVYDYKAKASRRETYPGPDNDGRGWAQCPMGWMREDLRPEARIARIVTHAVAADVDKRWPDVPNRLYQLVLKHRNADAAKDKARHEAERRVNRG